MSGSGERPLPISGSGRKTIQDVREWSGGPYKCPGVVGRPSQMSLSGRETHPDVPEWLEALPDVRE